MVNRDVVTKWVEALESGKYGQTKGTLASPPDADGRVRFCCLGVLSEVAANEGVIAPARKATPTDTDNNSKAGYAYQDGPDDPDEWETSELPNAVREWAGLTSSSLYVTVPYVKLFPDNGHDYGSDVTRRTLIELNDDHGWSFSDIAGAIREEFLETGGDGRP